MLLAVRDEIGNPRHRAVLVRDLADDPGRVQTGQTREVNGCLRLAGALEDAARAGSEREDVSRLNEVVWPLLRIDGDLDRARAVCSRVWASGSASLIRSFTALATMCVSCMMS